DPGGPHHDPRFRRRPLAQRRRAQVLSGREVHLVLAARREAGTIPCYLARHCYLEQRDGISSGSRAMEESKLAALAQWITGEGLAGPGDAEMMAGFCERGVAAGLPLASAVLFIDTLHPIHEGRAVRWSRATGKTEITDYGRTNEGEAAENWRATPFYR